MRPPQEPAGRLLALYGTLAGLALVLALARLATGPWYQLYNPGGSALLEGLPVEWEAVYYLVHFPSILGDDPPAYAYSPVHYRALVELWAAGALQAWTGSAYWALAVVDLAGWALAGAATYHLGWRLGAGGRGAALGALLTVGSPLLASNMWAHVLHVAEFASLPVGLWAALALLDGAAGPNLGGARERAGGMLRLAAGLGALLVGLSLTYQYQWVVAPLALAAARGRPGQAPRRPGRAGGPAGGGRRRGLYLVATLALRASSLRWRRPGLDLCGAAVSQPADYGPGPPARGDVPGRRPERLAHLLRAGDDGAGVSPAGIRRRAGRPGAAPVARPLAGRRRLWPGPGGGQPLPGAVDGDDRLSLRLPGGGGELRPCRRPGGAAPPGPARPQGLCGRPGAPLAVVAGVGLAGLLFAVTNADLAGDTASCAGGGVTTPGCPATDLMNIELKRLRGIGWSPDSPPPYPA